MSGFGRVTQEVVEALGPDQGSARITQQTVEALGPIPSTARVTQLIVEALVPTSPAFARVTQEIVEVLGPPGSAPPGACALTLASLNFTGNGTGLFYAKTDLGSEVIPIAYADTTVTLTAGTLSPNTQTLTVDGEWFTWMPDDGPLTVTLPESAPLRTLWVVTTQANASPPSIPVWASSQTYPPWKQTCTE